MWIGGVDREFPLGIFHPLCVENFLSSFVDDLHDRVLKVDLVFKMTGGFAAIVIVKIESERPARKLGILIFSDVGETLIALEGNLIGSFVKPGEAISISTLFLVAAVNWISVSKHRYFVAESIEIISGPRKRGIGNWVWPGLSIGRMPPTTVNGVDKGGGGEGKRPVVKSVNSMANRYGKVLVSTKMGGVSSADFAKGIVATSLGPSVGIEVGKQSIGWRTVNVNGTAKSGLAEDDFLLGSGPIL